MKKKIIIPVFIILILLAIITKYSYSIKFNDISNINNSEISIFEEEVLVNDSKEYNNSEVQEKIDTLRKRSELRGLIIKGDIYLKNEQLTLALKSYINAYKQNPKDEKTIKKIGDTYFEMKKYQNSYNYYKKITEYEYLDKDKLLLSLFYSKDLKELVNQKNVIKEIYNLGLNNEEIFYYENTIKCINEFHLCKKDFNTYFEENKLIENQNLLEIKNAIQNYRNFQVEEIYYKDALIIGAYLKNELYPISIIIGEDLLKEKEDYKPVIKIIGKSYYELGKYKDAKNLLGKYYALDNKDAGVIYLMGIIQSKLHEYILSNIYLNKAIDEGYKPSIDIRRKLIYNSYLLGNIDRLLAEFEALIENEDYEKEDLGLAIYYHIINKEYDFAIKWSNKGIEDYPKEETFYGYLGWIYKEKNELEKAKEYLTKGLEIKSGNPLLLLNMGYVYRYQDKINDSVIYFKKTIKINGNGEFGILAKEEIEKIQKEKNITNQ